jgi:uncharacterized membrane protein
MAKPMFVYAGVYDNVHDADADYEAIKALHAGEAIGSYDSAIISKQADGKVKVTKTEKPRSTAHRPGSPRAPVRPWSSRFCSPGLTVAGMAGAGAGLGAWFGHLAHGTSRGEAKEIGALLDQGDAALVVIGLDRDADRINPSGDAGQGQRPQARVRRLRRGRAGGARRDRAGRTGRLTPRTCRMSRRLRWSRRRSAARAAGRGGRPRRGRLEGSAGLRRTRR